VGLDPKVPGESRYRVQLEVESEGKISSLEAEGVAIMAAPLPNLTGYVPGDTHLHSTAGNDDGLNAVGTICNSAKQKGLEYLWFTAHAQKMGSSTNYNTYKTTVNNGGSSYGLFVSPDLEMSTRREYAATGLSPVGITIKGTKINSWVGNSDDGYHTYTLPWTFYHYGYAYNTLYVSTNGIVGFNSSNIGSTSFTAIPNSNLPNNFIAGCWRDLNPGAATGSNGVYVFHSGDVVDLIYYGVPIYGSASTVTFMIRLIKPDRIQVHYSSASGGYAGIEDSKGQYGFSRTVGNTFEATIGSDSHYLAHNITSYLENYAREYRNGEDIINRVNQVTNAYGTIAHPYNGTYPWRYWTKKSGSTDVKVTGFQSVELLNFSETAANTSLISVWVQRLNDNLQANIANNRVHPVATSGSDMHSYLQAPWGKKMTYIYCPTKSLSNLQNAMKQGRTVASSDGSLTSFYTTVVGTTYHVGSVVNISSGTSVVLRGKAVAASPNNISSVRVYRPDQTYVTVTTASDGTWSWQTPAIYSDTWYRVELRTTDINYYTYVTYTNPIILNVP
jgi:hypothetical protein